MIPIRTRIPTSSAIFTVCWCCGWAVGLFFILYYGQLHLGEGSDSQLITRAGQPGWYWSIVALITVMIGFVLSLTFEWDMSTDDDQE